MGFNKQEMADRYKKYVFKNKKDKNQQGSESKFPKREYVKFDYSKMIKYKDSQVNFCIVSPEKDRFFEAVRYYNMYKTPFELGRALYTELRPNLFLEFLMFLDEKEPEMAKRFLDAKADWISYCRYMYVVECSELKEHANDLNYEPTVKYLPVDSNPKWKVFKDKSIDIVSGESRNLASDEYRYIFAIIKNEKGKQELVSSDSKENSPLLKNIDFEKQLKNIRWDLYATFWTPGLWKWYAERYNLFYPEFYEYIKELFDEYYKEERQSKKLEEEVKEMEKSEDKIEVKEKVIEKESEPEKERNPIFNLFEKKDYYGVLGLKDGAEQTEIEASFKKLSEIYNPDSNPDMVKGEEMKVITEAYGELMFNEPMGMEEKKEEVKEEPPVPSTGRSVRGRGGARASRAPAKTRNRTGR